MPRSIYHMNNIRVDVERGPNFSSPALHCYPRLQIYSMLKLLSLICNNTHPKAISYLLLSHTPPVHLTHMLANSLVQLIVILM